MSKLPVFIGAGFTRSGTTWTFDQFRKHPEICTTQRKETRYFHDYWGKKGFFNKLEDRKKRHLVMGEYDPTYVSNNSQTIHHIKKAFPDPKIIFILRNPVERTYTMWKALRYKGNIPWKKSFLRYFRSRPQHFYLRAFQEWLDAFDNVGVFLYDDLKENSLKFIQSVYKFIGVDHKFVPPNYEEWHVSEYNKYYKKHPVYMNKNTEKKLYKLFRPMITKLENVIDRDLSSWKK